MYIVIVCLFLINLPGYILITATLVQFSVFFKHSIINMYYPICNVNNYHKSTIIKGQNLL